MKILGCDILYEISRLRQISYEISQRGMYIFMFYTDFYNYKNIFEKADLYIYVSLSLSRINMCLNFSHTLIT